jgi:conjugative relaxase-like TrwC/TraI family protein
LVVVLTIGRLGRGPAAADYYLDRQAGCELDYYTAGGGEPRGTWCGSAAAAFGVPRVLDGAGEAVLRGLLGGCGAAGAGLVPPVWRGDPRGRVPAAVLVRAVEHLATQRGVDPIDLFVDPSVERAFEVARVSVAGDARLPRRPRASVSVVIAGRIAAGAGLDPVEVFRDDRGRDVFGAALPFADARVDVRRSGLDLTFSAPKSVSVLFGLGDSLVSGSVREAHRAAVDQTVAYLEALCARAARGHHTPGQPYRRIETSGWAAVAFEHRSSRCGDPQLHTHVVVPNVVQGVDGKWSAWDTSEAYRQASTGGYLYQAVLRGELTRRLGVSWGPVRRGVAEIEGMPAGLRKAFSQRRQAIEAHLEAHGLSGPRAAQVAALRTRPAKQHQSDAELRAGWAGQVRAAGFAPQTVIDEVLGRTAPATARDQPTMSRPAEVRAVAERVLGAGGVTARSSTFDRRTLLRAVCEAVPAGSPVSVTSLREVATTMVRDPAVVPLIADAPVESRRYSTAELLVTEATALRVAAARADDRLAQVAPDVVDQAIGSTRLSGEQAAAVRRLLTSGAGVEVLVGPAGAGKTAALLAAARAWAAAGVEVRGVALAAIAARTLQTGTGIESQSLTRLTRAIRRGDLDKGLPAAGGVLVVDESGMVGTRDLAGLTELTDRARVKLVLVGDPAQLPEIDAGGLFAALAVELPATTLSGNVRQRDTWERAALTSLRDGDVLTAVDSYDAAGRLHLLDDAPSAREAIITDYLAARATSPAVVMLTSRRVDARMLNTAARAALLASDSLGDRALTVRSGARTVEWRVGDETVVTANHYPLGLINGSRGRVSAVDSAGVTVSTDAGAISVPVTSLSTGVLDYGYALTCHKAQGITVDVALVYASGTLTREAGYVGMSRGRVANHLYGTLDALLPEVDADLDHPGDDPITETERSDLTRAAVVARLETRGCQRLALGQADESARERAGGWFAPPEQVRASGRGR